MSRFRTIPLGLFIVWMVVALASVLSTSVSLAGPGAQEGETETWVGTLDAGGQQLRLQVQITRTEGEASGTLVSLDQNNATFPLSELVADGEVLSFTIPPLGASYQGEYADDGGSVVGTFSQGGAQLPLTFEPATDGEEPPASPGRLVEAWIGELQMGVMTPVMQFRIVELEDGEVVAFFDSVTEGRTGFPATFSSDGEKLHFDVESIQLTYRGTLNEAGDEAEGIWSQGGRDVPLTLKRQEAEYRTDNVWESRPQRPMAPFPYESEDVTFAGPAEDITLAGTLTIPEGPGPHPAVVLISGSGAQDRDESIAGHKPFLVLADHLSRRGLAVLRYDDRGFGESTGDFDAATTEDFARDAGSAVQFLTGHPRIASDQIGLAGHSEGGLVAPMVAQMRDDLAFVVLMAGTGVKGADVITSQTEAMLRVAGVDESEIELSTRVNAAIFEAVVAAEPGADVAPLLEPILDDVVQSLPESERATAGPAIRQSVDNSLGRLQSPWMRFFLAYDPVPALRAIDCPVLVVIGSKDLQVLPDLNLPAMRRALHEGANPDFEIVELEGLNHLFQTAGSGSMDEYPNIDETFSPTALQAISDWILVRFPASAAPEAAPCAGGACG